MLSFIVLSVFVMAVSGELTQCRSNITHCTEEYKDILLNH